MAYKLEPARADGLKRLLVHRVEGRELLAVNVQHRNELGRSGGRGG